MYKYIVLLHILAATVWVGGHLILVSTILPETFKKKDINLLLNFEQKYERIGMPSLLILVISGMYLAHTHFYHIFLSGLLLIRIFQNMPP